MLVDAPAGEKIVHLPHPDDAARPLGEMVEEGRAGWQDRRNPRRSAVRCQCARCSPERAGDDPRHAVLTGEQVARDAARGVQLARAGCSLIVRRDLEDRVGRGVDDPLAGGNLFGSKFVENRGARGRPVAEHAASGLLDELVDARRAGSRAGRSERAARESIRKAPSAPSCCPCRRSAAAPRRAPPSAPRGAAAPCRRNTRDQGVPGWGATVRASRAPRCRGWRCRCRHTPRCRAPRRHRRRRGR